MSTTTSSPSSAACWNCGEVSRYVVHTVPTCTVCRDCISRANFEAAQASGGQCPACGKAIGSRYGLFLRHHTSGTSLRREAKIVCDRCLRLMKDIVSHKRDSEYA